MAATMANAAVIIGPAQVADPKLWAPIEEESPAAEVVVEDGQKVLKLACPFSTLKGWRVGWDIEFKDGFPMSRWLRLKVRADDPEAVSNIVLYFESGPGWYRKGFGAPVATWRTLIGPRSKFETEGVPGAWGQVTRMRIAVFPGARRDTAVYLEGLQGTEAATIEDAGRIGPYDSLEQLAQLLGKTGEGKKALKEAEILLDKAKKAPDEAADEPQGLIRDSRRILTTAYAKLQKPKPDEMRAMWCHSGRGPEMGWEKAMELLKRNGFNTIFPNMLWAGTAYYPSKIVPNPKDVAEGRDYLKELLKAARKNGIKVHVWKVSWQFGWMADTSILVPYRFAGRMQVDREGKLGDWLCPVNIENRKYEMAAIRELVTNYDIDGFQFDYIRYDGDQWCFCPTCRAAFEKEAGKALPDWPKPVLAGGELEQRYRDFRRNAITSFVAEVRGMMKSVRPKMKLSADVFPDPVSSRESVLQDWTRWVKDGLLDFICPMNYTEDLAEMKARLKADLDAVGGKIPVIVGLYATYSPEQVQEPDMLVAQVAAARELGAAGFTLFEMEDHVMTGLLPFLRMGATSK